MKLTHCMDVLTKDLAVLQLCLNECMKGHVLGRNPYLRSPRLKKKIDALHEAIERVIQDILLFTGELAKLEGMQNTLHSYYRTYAFLFEFNDGIRKEENDHRILMRDQDIIAKFNRLQYHSDAICHKVKEGMHTDHE